MASSRLLAALLLFAAFVGAAFAADDLLYVWTGDDDHKEPDFLAVLEFDPTSPNYGKVVSKVDLTGPSAYGNEVRLIGGSDIAFSKSVFPPFCPCCNSGVAHVQLARGQWICE